MFRLRPSPKWKNTVLKGPLWSFGPNWIQEVQNGSENMFTQFSGQVSVSPRKWEGDVYWKLWNYPQRTDPHQVSQNWFGYHPSSSVLLWKPEKAIWAPISRGPSRHFWEAVGREPTEVFVEKQIWWSPHPCGQYSSGQWPDYEICKYQKVFWNLAWLLSGRTWEDVLEGPPGRWDSEWPQTESPWQSCTPLPSAPLTQ